MARMGRPYDVVLASLERQIQPSQLSQALASLLASSHHRSLPSPPPPGPQPHLLSNSQLPATPAAVSAREASAEAKRARRRRQAATTGSTPRRRSPRGASGGGAGRRRARGGRRCGWGIFDRGSRRRRSRRRMGNLRSTTSNNGRFSLKVRRTQASRSMPPSSSVGFVLAPAPCPIP